MKKIHRLPQHIISKIAAGEVIERPAYAVKELLENAIDAKATIIEIQIEESGLKRITVSDNGEGMSKEDLEICFLPHTTSKLKHPEDLTKIKSLGFRGEALAAIAAVSHMTIITRTPKDIGGRIIQIKGGIVEDSAPIGSPIGTIVTAEGLFYSVPARKKFLKSAQTEFRHITETVLKYALMFPEIHFVLKHNKKTVLEFPPKKTGEERILSLFGSSLMDEMMKLAYEDGHIRIEGMIGKPQVALKQNQKQYIFVNKRSISDRMISLSVREAFGTLLPSSHTPVFFLSITLPHEHVDVNIHPRKEQVAFAQQKQLFDAVKTAVTEILKENNITFQLAKFKQEYSAKLGETQSEAGNILKKAVLPWNRSGTIAITTNKTPFQIAHRYIAIETEESVIFIDQHGAHERILYHQFSKAFTEAGKETHKIKTPKRVKLSEPELQTATEYQQKLHDLSFHFTINNASEIELISVPSVLEGRNIEKVFREILGELAEHEEFNILELTGHRMLAFLACRAAVKAEDSLTESEMESLIKQLEVTPNNATCPHGRPTKITVTLHELDNAFGRS